MDGRQQAAFFDSLGEIKRNEGYWFDMQMLHMRGHLSGLGRKILTELADEVREWDEY